jgi:hypothetical protein
MDAGNSSTQYDQMNEVITTIDFIFPFSGILPGFHLGSGKYFTFLNEWKKSFIRGQQINFSLQQNHVRHAIDFLFKTRQEGTFRI